MSLRDIAWLSDEMHHDRLPADSSVFAKKQPIEKQFSQTCVINHKIYWICLPGRLIKGPKSML